MNDKALELKKIAQKLDQKALRYSKKIEKTFSNKELEKLEELEAEAKKVWDEYFKEYYRSIGAKEPEFKEPDFPPYYYPDDEIGYIEYGCSETDRDRCC